MWTATDSMRLELAPRGVQVMGVYVGLVDTDMADFADSPKADPADVIRQVLDGIESGADEVLADELTRRVRAQLGESDSRASAGREQYGGVMGCQLSVTMTLPALALPLSANAIASRVLSKPKAVSMTGRIAPAS